MIRFKTLCSDNFNTPHEIPLKTKIRDLIDSERQNEKFYYGKDHNYFPLLEEAMKSSETVYQWRRHYVRENKSNVCPTLTANMGTGGHNVPLITDDYGIRKLTKSSRAVQGFEKRNIPISL